MKLGVGTAAAAAARPRTTPDRTWFWFFSAYSDVRNVNRREIDAFPIDLPGAEKRHGGAMSELATKLMVGDFERNSAMTKINYARVGVLTIQVFRPRISKPVIDSIDSELAELYGFTDEEAEFLINRDIKYRLGVDAGDEEEGA